MKKVFGIDLFTLVITVIIMALVFYHIYQYFKFQNNVALYLQHTKAALTIPHLTIYDGQALCERIAAVEKDPKPCTFVEGVR